MDGEREFVDYYELLQVRPNCSSDILAKAYRHFASKYHPDHPETADREKFQKVTEGYAMLRDAGKRAEYDRQHRVRANQSFYSFLSQEEVRANEKTAAHDAETHERILFFLYRRRREHPSDPGVIAYYLQKMLDCTDESFDFHMWYLKSKGLIHTSEQNEVEITIEGIDYILTTSHTSETARLLQSPPASIDPGPDLQGRD